MLEEPRQIRRLAVSPIELPAAVQYAQYWRPHAEPQAWNLAGRDYYGFRNVSANRVIRLHQGKRRVF